MSRLLSSEKQRERMLNESVPKLVTELALPTVVIQLITLIYNTADTYFVSQIDKSASAAVGAVYAVMSLIQAVGFGFGMGSSSLCSIRLGEKKDNEAARYCSSAFFAAIGMGALLGTTGLIFLEPLLKLIGCSETMMSHATAYARWILIAAPLSCPTFVLNSLLRAEGQTKHAMIGNVAGGILNIILDPLFIFKFNMGTGGAALATAISQLCNFSILFFQFASKRTIMPIKFKLVSKKAITYRDIITTGIPTVFRQGLSSVATSSMSRQAVIYGDAAVAALTISNKCYMIVRNIVIGVGQGFLPVAGYNYGAQKYDRTKKSFWFVSAVGTVACVICTLIFAFFAEPIMWWFCKDAQVAEYGKAVLYYSCFSLPVLAFSTYINQLYQGLGYRWRATFLASCRQGIFYLPIVWILPRFIGVTGVLAAQPTADFFTFLISLPFLYWMLKKELKTTIK